MPPPPNRLLILANSIILLSMAGLLGVGLAILTKVSSGLDALRVLGLLPLAFGGIVAVQAYRAVWHAEPKAARDTNGACLILSTIIWLYGGFVLLLALAGVPGAIYMAGNCLALYLFFRETGRLNGEHADRVSAWREQNPPVETSVWQFSVRDLLALMTLAALTLMVWRWIPVRL